MTAATAPVQLLSIPEAAKALRCSENHVYRLVGRGELRTVDVGNGRRPKSRIRSDDLQTFIDRHTAAPMGTRAT
jgi:excisionase family DNA binding protein